MKVDYPSSADEPSFAARPEVRAPVRMVKVGDIPIIHVLDAIAWNDLASDAGPDLILEKLHLRGHRADRFACKHPSLRSA